MDRETIRLVLQLLGVLVFASQVFVIPLLLIAFVGSWKNIKALKPLSNFFIVNSLTFAFLIATIATVGSLFLSEVAHFAPCKLCWFQRIFMYPQVILLGIASVKNEESIRKYILTLSGVGLFIAVYHYALQMYPTILPCTDEVASCAARQYAYFGYITIPLMSATAFLIIMLLMFLKKKSR